MIVTLAASQPSHLPLSCHTGKCDTSRPYVDDSLFYRILEWQRDQLPAPDALESNHDDHRDHHDNHQHDRQHDHHYNDHHNPDPKAEHAYKWHKMADASRHSNSPSPKKRARVSSQEHDFNTDADTSQEDHTTTELSFSTTQFQTSPNTNLTQFESAPVPPRQSLDETSAGWNEAAMAEITRRRQSPTRTRMSPRRSLQTSDAVSISRSHTSQSRQSSPSKGGNRQKRIMLEFTEPPIYLGILDEAASMGQLDDGPGCVPEIIAALIRDLSEVTATPNCIPAGFRSQIDQYSCFTEVIPEEAYSTSLPTSTSRPFSYIRSIYANANETFCSHSDESAWYPIIQSALNSISDKEDSASMLAIDNSQSKSVCNELLPLCEGGPIPTVKTDFLLQLKRKHKDVAAVLKPLFRNHPKLSLSAFNDPVAATTFTAAIIEVKSPSGDFDEGLYQFSVAAAAVFARLQVLNDKDCQGQEPSRASKLNKAIPVIGWVVHGHFWYLHVASKQADSSIRVLGPFPSGNTATLLGIFRLLKILETAKGWVEREYWPCLREFVEAMV